MSQVLVLGSITDGPGFISMSPAWSSISCINNKVVFAWHFARTSAHFLPGGILTKILILCENGGLPWLCRKKVLLKAGKTSCGMSGRYGSFVRAMSVTTVSQTVKQKKKSIMKMLIHKYLLHNNVQN